MAQHSPVGGWVGGCANAAQRGARGARDVIGLSTARRSQCTAVQEVQGVWWAEHSPEVAVHRGARGAGSVVG